MSVQVADPALAASGQDWVQRVAALDWLHLAGELDGHGCATIPGLLTVDECAALVGLYQADDPFRSRVVMARHGYGSGEYKYFRYPLPAVVQALRSAVYQHLAPLANRWSEAMGSDLRYPEQHDAFIARCQATGQAQPTPLLPQYRRGDYNCLHQDLYDAT